MSLEQSHRQPLGSREWRWAHASVHLNEIKKLNQDQEQKKIKYIQSLKKLPALFVVCATVCARHGIGAMDHEP